MFKKNNKSILNPSLPNSQIRSLMTTPTPLSMPTASKGPSITKQLLAKFENKYSGKVKTAESTDSDISNLEPSAGKETLVEVNKEFNKLPGEDVDEEAIYESDFETSDSDVPENEKSTNVSQTRFQNSNPPKNTGETPEESIHENILTFEELMKLNGNPKETPAVQIINNEQDDISELLENEMEEISISSNIQQYKSRSTKSNSQEVSLNGKIIIPSELLRDDKKLITVSRNQVPIENVIKDTEIVKELKEESSKQSVNIGLNALERSAKEVSSAKNISPCITEQVVIKKLSSPDKTTENITPERELRLKSKSKRKSNARSLEEKRRLERMYFLVEKQSLQGVVQQPVLKPLVMSWEREAETTEEALHTHLATPEDAFAEMLRLRLRLTRDKMAAEYAAYRSCCEATRILALSHQPVTLAATRQIISQLKQPNQPELDP